MGDRTIRGLVVTVYYLDRDGKRIGEKSEALVGGGYVRDEKVLKPNYSEERGIMFVHKSVEWGGRSEYEISYIRFADNEKSVVTRDA